jgi:hypothetical protein
MTDPFDARPRRSFEIKPVPGWAVFLVAILAGALGVGLFLLSASVLLILAPIVVATALYYRWRIRKVLRDAARNGEAVDAEYRVVTWREDR